MSSFGIGSCCLPVCSTCTFGVAESSFAGIALKVLWSECPGLVGNQHLGCEDDFRRFTVSRDLREAQLDSKSN
jgi:hypothetical protein